jgi:hypothetical protein
MPVELERAADGDHPADKQRATQLRGLSIDWGDSSGRWLQAHSHSGAPRCSLNNAIHVGQQK